MLIKKDLYEMIKYQNSNIPLKNEYYVQYI